MKKGLKIGLIVGGSILVAGGARAGLTKAGIIPNWFDIQGLYHKRGYKIPAEEENPGIVTVHYVYSRGGEAAEDQTGIYLSGMVFSFDSPEIEHYEADVDSVTGTGKNEEQCFTVTYTPNTDVNENGIADEEENPQGGGNIDSFTEDCKCEDSDCYIKSCYYEGFDEPIIVFDYPCDDEYNCYDKPIIYLYPTTETKVNVKLGSPENLLHTYPKYNSEKGRNVIAQPNGDLKDIDTGRKLYALYREGKSNIETNFDEGFVVAGKDIIPFLEDKLAILGLNEREAEEFIVYRLPQMEGNGRNLIRFETVEEQNENMPLNITPKPDTVIRVMMDWKAIDEPIDIPEQHLTTPERNGFTVVERGGSQRK